MNAAQTTPRQNLVRLVRKKEEILFPKSFETHNSDGEVVVDDLVRHRVALLLVLVRGDLHAPAVHQHHRTALDVLQDATQVLPVVACRGRRTGSAQS